MKRIIAIVMVVALALLLMAVPVMAKGPNGPAGKSNVGHINLVEKDANWDVVSYNGKLKYSISDDTLDVVLNAKGLVSGDWYLIELNDKNAAAWNVISPDNCNSFYAQANGGGNIHAEFSCAVKSGMVVEVNVKNAENVALLECSTYGVPAEWILGTGQGWTYMLYSEDTIPIP